MATALAPVFPLSEVCRAIAILIYRMSSPVKQGEAAATPLS